MTGTARAWLELLRLSNAPTVLSNVLTGAVIGAAAHDWIAWRVVAGAAAGLLLMYAGGMALNDVVDAPVDRAERPQRPIPSGRIPRAAALAAAVAALAGGVALLAVAGRAAVGLGAVLAAAIVAYDLIHGKTALSVLLMGGCRALVYLIAAAAVAWPLDWPVAAPPVAALAGYTVLLTVVARAEARAQPDRRGALVALLPVAALLPAAALWPPARPAVALGGAAPLIAWLAASARHVRARPPRIGRAVGAWLAGFCLLDLFYLLWFDRPVLAGLAGGLFVVTVLAHRRVEGT